jgi:hypothetical protein
MHNEKKYRLGDYLITISDNGQIEWQGHAALGMERRGKCFLLENILIFGRCRDEDHGYLKMEFHDHLRKLPPWTKTAHYCSSVNLLDVISGQVVTEDFLQEITTLAQIKGASVNSANDIKQGAFRLGQYYINVAEDGNISWQAIEGLNNIIGGPCRIESNVLFICPREYVQEHQNKRHFLDNLHRLPQWNNTIAWCRGMVLEGCRPLHETRQYHAVRGTENIRHKFIHSQHSDDRATFTIPLSSAFKRLSALWPRIRRGKALFKQLIPAALGAFVSLVGLTLIFYTIGKGCHVPHGDDDHHHNKQEHDED